jgi:hypothetical protein
MKFQLYISKQKKKNISNNTAKQLKSIEFFGDLTPVFKSIFEKKKIYFIHKIFSLPFILGICSSIRVNVYLGGTSIIDHLALFVIILDN